MKIKNYLTKLALAGVLATFSTGCATKVGTANNYAYLTKSKTSFYKVASQTANDQKLAINRVNSAKYDLENKIKGTSGFFSKIQNKIVDRNATPVKVIYNSKQDYINDLKETSLAKENMDKYLTYGQITTSGLITIYFLYNMGSSGSSTRGSTPTPSGPTYGTPSSGSSSVFGSIRN